MSFLMSFLSDKQYCFNNALQDPLSSVYKLTCQQGSQLAHLTPEWHIYPKSDTLVPCSGLYLAQMYLQLHLATESPIAEFAIGRP